MQKPARAVALAVPAALSALVLGCWEPVAAQNWTAVLKNTPAEDLNEDDVRLLGEVARKVLNDPQDSASGSWINSTTRNQGQITAEKSFRWRDHPCRSLRLDYEVGGRKGSTPISLCQVEGRWKAVSASEIGDAASP
ncbi:hypothetical protein OOT46_03515 [Aquabacterium sp. A7-Y]|uniref:hypothetical protein n=1 Tax=Aquabacterium sp. A7-Y TaxID=1349605 RepID=UPI00223CDDC2|nr:hypothetical protein [Aquabacterium sp. A7-Y]MCW7536920.1 hypothetical protein [Aquabacterium sp. A7-Y]